PPPPAASPSPAKPRAHKKAKTEVAASPAPSPSPAKPMFGGLFKPKPSPSASPAGAKPAPATRTTTAAATKATPAPGGGPGMVWVNTDSHIYHKEGSRFYGKTKTGKYMTEQEALKEGNRAAARDLELDREVGRNRRQNYCDSKLPRASPVTVVWIAVVAVFPPLQRAMTERRGWAS